jgi:hypothetical protein
VRSEDEEIAAAFSDLRGRVEAGHAERGRDEQALREARDEAERFWPVTGEREFLARPGRAGRVRAALLAPVKSLLRPLLRWYVEPALADQRRFNAAVLRMLDELLRERGSRADRRDN